MKIRIQKEVDQVISFNKPWELPIEPPEYEIYDIDGPMEPASAFEIISRPKPVVYINHHRSVPENTCLHVDVGELFLGHVFVFSPDVWYDLDRHYVLKTGHRLGEALVEVRRVDWPMP